MLRVCGIAFVFCSIALSQGGPHWGVQGSFTEGEVPEFIVERFQDLTDENPAIRAQTYNVGGVRFHADGSPSWAVEFTRSRVNLEGSLQTGPFTQELRGSGSLRGVMATKYINFFSRRMFSAGLAFGGGIGKLEASYYRYVVPPGPVIIFDREEIDYVVPTFQAVAQADFRPVRWISLSPFYGMRNGALGVGGALRIHFTK